MEVLWWVVFAAVVALFALAVYARHRYLHPHQRRLEYRWRVYSPSGWEAASVWTWRKRCEASLHASRQRRGLE